MKQVDNLLLTFLIEKFYCSVALLVDHFLMLFVRVSFLYIGANLLASKLLLLFRNIGFNCYIPMLLDFICC